MTYRPLWVTVLPSERRARHPYQLGAMLMLITVSISQLAIGPVSNSALNKLPSGQSEWLNWFGIVVGAAGLAAAVIPERLVRVWRWEVDATWWRLVTELAAHGGMVFTGLTYFTAFTLARSVEASTPGELLALSLASGAALWLASASLWRCGQILWTVRKALIQPPGPSTIVSAETVGSDDDR